MRVLSSAALALVPRDLRRLAGVDRSPALDAAAIAAARPLVVSLGLPGFREVHRVVVGRETTEIGRAALMPDNAAAA
jgi:hypothetical protein